MSTKKDATPKSPKTGEEITKVADPELAKVGEEGENPTAEWTVMIYLAGDNNLADDCVNALLGMKDAHVGNSIQVIAQFDPSDTRLSTQRLVIDLEEKPNGPSLATLSPQGPSSKLTKDHVEVKGGKIKFDDKREGSLQRTPESEEEDDTETDTALPKTLFDFISWSTENFPAHRYMLILAGHAAGVEEGYLLKDENPPNAMKLEGLKEVLTQVDQNLKISLDILGLDSCLMNRVEICYELRGLVEIIVGSQSMTPNPGWPYGRILEIMKSRDGGKIEADKLAPIIVSEYINSYVEHAANSGLSTDLAALRVDASVHVAQRVKELGEAISDKLNNGDVAFKNALILAHWEAQSYNGELFVDLCDFCELLVKHYDDVDIARKCGKVKKEINNMVLSTCFCGVDYQYSNGLSIYFPWATIFKNYKRLAFAQEDGADWFNFLFTYVEGTRREPRGGEGRGLKARFLLDSRKVFPISHGPVGIVHSMRNPPNKWNKIPDCISAQHKEELDHLFSLFP
jgi:hypothetical protein